MRELAGELLDFVDEVVDELHSRDEVQHLRSVLDRGTSADQQIAVFTKTNDMKAVVSHVVEETRRGL